jgi:hypothetical protein
VPDLHPADVRLQALNAWDASACVRPDVAADEAHLHLRPQQQREAVVEKWAGRALDAQVRDGMSHRSELQAAPAAELAAPALCTLDVARSAERSCAAPEAAELPGALKLEPLAERSPKPPEAQRELEPQAAAPRAAQAVQQLAMRKLAALLPAREAQPQPAYRQRTAARSSAAAALPAVQPLALKEEAQLQAWVRTALLEPA